MRRHSVGAVRAMIVALMLVVVGAPLLGQGTLSQQVLQLLSRTNAWIGTNTFSDIRLPTGPCGATPSITTGRIYTDVSCNLYFNGGLIAGVGGVTNPHNLLSTTHSDTLAAAVVRGDVIIGNATPAWSRLAVGSAGNMLRSNGTDVSWGTDASALTNIPAANLTGTVAAISGVNLTNLNATNLASGTVPLARLSGITTSQLAAGAGIVYSQLSLTGGIVNADVNAAAAIAYAKLNLTGLVVNGDLTNATILFAKWATNSCTSSQVPQFNGSAWVCRTLATSDVTGAGTVTSVNLAVPAQFTVSGGPITNTGTITISQATQSANLVLAGPTTGAATTPTFRALVNADLPLSGVSAATYPKVTVNTAGVVTAASSQITLTTDVTGTLPMANGGTGVAVSADDTVLIGSGAAWVAQTLPNCPTGSLAYTQSTNLFNCSSAVTAHNLLSATHGDTVAASAVRGDILVANATPAWARKAIGTAGQLLTNNAADTNWGSTFATGSLGASTPWTWTQTWNAAATFVASVVNVTDTSSNQDSKFVDYQTAGTSKWYLREKDGFVVPAGVAFASLPATPINGMQGFCTDCLKGSNPCSGSSTGAIAVRLNGVWRCD